ncbi:hypothetical protein N3K66_002273 [Trichothecium roseum]|uniref:Uncharacterized protein n=1 Tax=Trichothecium roseum TaxID=47278 RepID=A0ACC0V8W0_9HYPO|nr:hypothetical protein N3K66_002273 [Trichothecium roseum]
MDPHPRRIPGSKSGCMSSTMEAVGNNGTLDIASQQNVTRQKRGIDSTLPTAGGSVSEGLLFNERDRVRNSPSTDQIVEDLLSIIMGGLTIEPLTVQHTSMVAKLIEGYGQLKRELVGAELRASEASQHLQQQKHDFDILAGRWVKQQDTYKAEIKRLEVLLLQQTPEKGVESVSIARSGSLLQRGTNKKPQIETKEPIRGYAGTANSIGDEKMASAEERSTTAHKPRGGHDHRSVLSRPRTLDPANDITLSRQLHSMRPSYRIQGILERSSRTAGK